MDLSNVYPGQANTLGMDGNTVFANASNPGGARRFTLESRVEDRDPQSRKVATILLVEDNPADAGLVRRALEEHGVAGELIVVSDGEKAIHFIQSLDDGVEPCPDLVIVDLNLPKRPGRDVLARMRLSEKCSGVPVVILSSSDARQDRAEAARLGASHYLRKPLRLEEFLALGATFKQLLGSSIDE